MTEQEILAKLTDYVQTELLQGRPALALTPDYPIIVAGLIDSLSLFKLIAFMEEMFGAKIQPDEIILDNFETLHAITNMLKRKLAQTREAG